MINLLQKHWEWQADRRPMLKHGSVVRLTMFLASMDMKTAIDEARPMHVEIMEGRNVHRWIIAALLARDDWATGTGNVRMHGKQIFLRAIARCLRHKSVKDPRLWQKTAMQLMAKVEEEWVRKRVCVLLDLDGQPAGFAFFVGRQFLGQVIDTIQFDPLSLTKSWSPPSSLSSPQS